jgi:hypothetical protein
MLLSSLSTIHNVVTMLLGSMLITDYAAQLSCSVGQTELLCSVKKKY